MCRLCGFRRLAPLEAASFVACGDLASSASAQQSLPTIQVGRAARKIQNSGIERFETPAVTKTRTPEKAAQALGGTTVVNRGYIVRPRGPA